MLCYTLSSSFAFGPRERRCETTIKEGMLDKTSLIMVVDKRATIAVNSPARLGSLSG